MESSRNISKARLTQVTIHGLYGSDRPICLGFAGSAPPNDPVTILYGDNGSGKTTILKLLYAALSPEDNAGHRGFLGRAHFQNIVIEFEDSQRIEINKSEEKSYEYRFLGGSEDFAVPVYMSENSIAPRSLNPSTDKIVSALNALAPPMVIVSDYRTIKSSQQPWDLNINIREIRQEIEWERRNRSNSYANDAEIEVLSTAALERLISIAQRNLLSSAMSSNARANTEASQIYLQITQTIADPKFGENNNNIAGEKKKLMNRLAGVASQAASQARFGLMDSTNLGPMIDQLAQTDNPNALSALIPILNPYVASLEQRLEANAELTLVLQTFSDKLNSFFRRKSINLHLRNLFEIRNSSSDRVDVGMLSSGERHLLSLFTVALLSRDTDSLVLIDEPEISLNYIWQRNIIQSLLDISSHSAHFVVASHSFEVISSYRKNVVNISDY